VVLDYPKGKFKRMNVALIITTFNWPNALRLVLLSITQQTKKPDQVIIADDGSKNETQDVIAEFKRILPIIHTWQADKSFRAARSRNLALAKVESPYLILIDGDCLLPPRFVEGHLKLAEENKVIAGSRNLLSPHVTKKLLLNASIKELAASFSSIKFQRWPVNSFRGLTPSNWKIVRSCNMSLHTDRILNIGGFDESFVGWGLEDSDCVVRLINAGVEVKNGRFATCVNHLFHHHNTRGHLCNNKRLFQSSLTEDGLYFARKTSLEKL